MYLIQILLGLFFLYAFIKTVSRWRAGDITGVMAVMWLLVWCAGIIIALNPNSTFYLARWLGVARGADAVVYVSLAILFFVVFRLLVHIERLERAVTVLTREIALKESQRKDVVEK